MKKKLSVTDQSPHTVVKSMATNLGVDYLEEKFVCAMELPPVMGSGAVRAYEFKYGFGIIHTEYNLNKDFHFALGKEMVHPLKLIFNTGDTFKHKLERAGQWVEVNFSEVIIVASTQSNNHQFIVPAKTQSDIFSIEINRKRFEKRIVDFMEGMDTELSGLFRDSNGVIPFTYKGPYSYDIGLLIESFKNCRLQGLNRYLYLEAKAYEIFTSFLAQYLDDTKQPDKRSIFRKNQTLQIKHAGEFIKENLENLPTVQELSKKFGLSSNILQNGFKSIYDMTVNEFVQNERLIATRKLLDESDYSISEITYMVGLNSKSYLSKIFAQRYSMTPSEYRNKRYKKGDGTN